MTTDHGAGRHKGEVPTADSALPGATSGRRRRPMWIAVAIAIAAVVAGTVTYAVVQNMENRAEIDSGYPLGYDMGYRYQGSLPSTAHNADDVLAACESDWDLAETREPGWTKSSVLDGCEDGFDDARRGEEPRWHRGNLPAYSVTLEPGELPEHTPSPAAPAPSPTPTPPASPPATSPASPLPREEPELPEQAPATLLETFEAMLAAVDRDGESGLAPYLADPSQGDLWGISDHQWSRPECSENTDGPSGCVAWFDNDGPLIENIFIFEHRRGVWLLTDSYVW